MWRGTNHFGQYANTYTADYNHGSVNAYIYTVPTDTNIYTPSAYRH
jgi:hypothetical protein